MEEALDRKISFRIYLVLIASLALLAGISLFLPQGEIGLSLPQAPLPAPLPVLALANAGIILVIYGGLGLIGLMLARKLGLPEVWDYTLSNRRRFVLPALVGAGLGIVLIIAAVPLINLFRQKRRGPAARAQFLESINDELGLIAALFGTLFILWGQPIADPVASILVATIIAYNGLKLFLENFSFLLGRSPGPKYLGQLESLARSVPGVVGVHDLRAEYIGPETVHAGMHVEVRPGITIEDAERIRKEVDEKVHQEVSPGYCVIQVEPAAPDS